MATFGPHSGNATRQLPQRFWDEILERLAAACTRETKLSLVLSRLATMFRRESNSWRGDSQRMLLERRTGENCRSTKLPFTRATKTSASFRARTSRRPNQAFMKLLGWNETVEYCSVSILINSYTTFKKSFGMLQLIIPSYTVHTF